MHPVKDDAYVQALNNYRRRGGTREDFRLLREAVVRRAQLALNAFEAQLSKPSRQREFSAYELKEIHDRFREKLIPSVAWLEEIEGHV